MDIHIHVPTLVITLPTWGWALVAIVAGWLASLVLRSIAKGPDALALLGILIPAVVIGVALLAAGGIFGGTGFGTFAVASGLFLLSCSAITFIRG